MIEITALVLTLDVQKIWGTQEKGTEQCTS